ncbi:bifunctional riboflavin kinase/FAD synthetase [Flavobacterium difficile]|uniref:Riboflavin biosynthesis protein n=1 Tax=Flavobacterium difficile TaxID=2709659 RepID=A0ABX0I3C3_9FLAO|nr:bifunctional riboflavin kinase/FAD synthetase [Flavobacterium difficile]NHM01698.1 bifunctional riboflavin kinase/FAD synthetase [Flavobacterium difficile]
MKIYQSLYDFNTVKKTVLTLGTFDGVHVGHAAILSQICNAAKEEDLESVILTFFPHPRLIVSTNYDIKLLNTMDEKAILLEKNGIQNFIIHPFDKAFSELSPREFVAQVLVEKLKVQKIIIGHDHKFGKNRAADFNDLIDFGKEFGFEVAEISAQQINDVSVSSTKIRNSLLEGNIALANQYLGYPYVLSGNVVKGRQLGRTIGFPTANIEVPEDYKLIPKNGVYIVTVIVNNEMVPGMMNIGVKPTLGENNLSVEVHLLNFDKDIYNQKIQVNVLERLRDEQKFASFEKLQSQIELDKQNTIRYFQK